MGDNIDNALGIFVCFNEIVAEKIKEFMWYKRRQEFLMQKGNTGVELWYVVGEFKDMLKETPEKAKYYECAIMCHLYTRAVSSIF